ncbi:Uncharacterised protein [Mycobacteroides abscessus subsp. abscessus]|nr:Uncharacterised protein [Mycobacteroides abscessus subsp. abscessus]
MILGLKTLSSFTSPFSSLKKAANILLSSPIWLAERPTPGLS